MPATVTAVVLNWNQSQMTLDCVAALRQSERTCDRIVVVDNGSRSDQRAILTDGLPATSAAFLQLSNNRGFAGGMNAAIREAARFASKSNYVWLVNNDAFPEPNCLGRLIEVMEADPTLVCVTPRLVGTDGEEQPAGGRYDVRQARNADVENREFDQPVGPGGYWAVATAPLVRTATFLQAGGFDDRFFAYWEEVDLCLRLARSGYRFQAVPDVTVLHLGRVSSGESNFGYHLYTRNQYWLLRKHGTQRWSAAIRLMRDHLDRAGCYESHGQHAKAQSVIQALIAGVLRESGPPRWYGRAVNFSAFLARHPWRLVKLLDLALAASNRHLVP